jgi:hypothetical protein
MLVADPGNNGLNSHNGENQGLKNPDPSGGTGELGGHGRFGSLLLCELEFRAWSFFETCFQGPRLWILLEVPQSPFRGDSSSSSGIS